MEKVKIALEEVMGGTPWLWDAIQLPSAVEEVTPGLSQVDDWQWAAIVIIGIVAFVALVALAHHFKDDE